MSVDVLSYNELVKDVNNLRDVCVPAANAVYSALGTANGTANGTASSFINSPVKSCNYGLRAACLLKTNPADCTLWSKVPTLNSVTCGFLICDPSGNFRCGSCCLWTVPAEARFIRFQLWGAGAGSMGVLCCGISLPGGTGAYGSVIIPAVSGCQYTLCSGCAYCCYHCCTQGSPGVNTGCASYVTGHGLCNFCADGGEGNAYNMIQRYTNCSADSNGLCILLNLEGIQSMCVRVGPYGACMCSWGGLCFSSSCNGGFILPSCTSYTTSCRGYYGYTTIAQNSCNYVVGIPGMLPRLFNYPAASCYCYNMPPIFGCCASSALTCWMGPGNNICGGGTPTQTPAVGIGGAAASFGLGAYASSAGAGATGVTGGIGNMGAICVQWTSSN